MIFTANTTDDFDRLLNWYGNTLDGLITDSPSLLASWVDTNPHVSAMAKKPLFKFVNGAKSIEEEDFEIAVFLL